MLRTLTKIFCIIFYVSVIAGCAMQSAKNKEQIKSGGMPGGPAHYNEAIAAAKEGKTEKAIILLEKVTQTNPDFSVAYTDLGLQYLRKDNLQAADRAFEKSISLNSSDFVAYNHRGVILRKQGDFAGAKDMYQTAIDQNPDYANAHLNFAVLYDIYLYELDHAMQHYKKYQSLTSNDDKLVGKWIVDLDRRISAKNKRNK